MHRLEDVIKNLKEERDSRSQRSLYGEESSVGKGVNKGAASKDGKPPAKQQNADSKSKPQQRRQQQKQPQPQQEQSSVDAQSEPNGNANGHVADIDSAVAQSVAEKLVL